MSKKTSRPKMARTRTSDDSSPQASVESSPGVNAPPSVRGVDVFEYLDYRAFLRDYYLERKEHERGFSFRAFSREAGLRSPNYLKLVMDKERNLTSQMAVRFALACGLSGDGALYFQDLVGFNQATTGPERNAFFQRLTGFRKYRKAHPLTLAQAEYHSTWYMPAIRELAARPDFRDDPAWIARMLRPRIRTEEAAHAVAKLVELGLLVRDEQGRVRQGEPLVSTPAETRSLDIANYHRSMIAQASASIDEFPSAQRDISSLTLCLGPEGLSRLKERLVRFRRELLELSSAETTPEQVVQVNFQLFPLSASKEDE